MPNRLLFRMTYYLNLQVYLEDKYLFAKNHPNVQECYRVSYEEIVARRGQMQFTTPCGSNLNDFVPFYFSPITKMAYSIYAGNVPLRSPDGENLGPANLDDLAYLVVSPNTLFYSGRKCWYTDIACNSAIPPNYEDRLDGLEQHVSWQLFDEMPRKALVPEIGYEGVCRWQHDRDEPVQHQQRSKKRMAEFMVRDYLSMLELECIILKSEAHRQLVATWVNDSGMNIPVLANSGCYF